tara:strand:- start:243 stop:437 length:195 start_codon:yes stop_codon:yes gene_type:complete
MDNKPETCRFLEDCPLWDMSSSGQEWCLGHIPHDDEWERCPMPLKAQEALKALKAKDDGESNEI